MTCPAFSVAPGDPGTPALWGAPVTLAASTGGFGVGGLSQSVRLLCAAGEQHPAEVTLWTDMLVLAALPPDPGCAGPFELRVQIPRLTPPDDVCLQPIEILDAPLFTGASQLLTLAQQFRIELVDQFTGPPEDADAAIARSGAPRRRTPPRRIPGDLSTPVHLATAQPNPRYRLELVHPALPGRFIEEITSALGVTRQASPVAVEVRWRVTDDTGEPVGDVSWEIVGASEPAQGVGGGAIHAPLGTDALKPLELVFVPPFRELEVPDPADPALVVRRRVSAAVRLYVGLNSLGDWVEVPPLELLLPAIPFPTILVLFQFVNFRGRKAVVVPAQSPIDRDRVVDDRLESVRELFDVLDQYDYEGGPGFGVLGGATEVITKLNSLLDKLESESEIGFAKADAARLRIYVGTTASPSWADTSDDNVIMENRISSLFLIGAPGRMARLFNDGAFRPGEGQITVACGRELFVAISNLHSAMPVSEPQGRVIGVAPAPTFGDDLASMQFGWRDEG